MKISQICSAIGNNTPLYIPGGLLCFKGSRYSVLICQFRISTQLLNRRGVSRSKAPPGLTRVPLKQHANVGRVGGGLNSAIKQNRLSFLTSNDIPRETSRIYRLHKFYRGIIYNCKNTQKEEPHIYFFNKPYKIPLISIIYTFKIPKGKAIN